MPPVSMRSVLFANVSVVAANVNYGQSNYSVAIGLITGEFCKRLQALVQDVVITCKNVAEAGYLAFYLVSVHVSPQVNLAHERDTTIVTRERLKSFVLPTVRDQIGRLAERLAAKAALVGFLARVDVGMFLHVRLLMKPLATELALKRARV